MARILLVRRRPLASLPDRASSLGDGRTVASDLPRSDCPRTNRSPTPRCNSSSPGRSPHHSATHIQPRRPRRGDAWPAGTAHSWACRASHQSHTSKYRLASVPWRSRGAMPTSHCMHARLATATLHHTHQHIDTRRPSTTIVLKRAAQPPPPPPPLSVARSSLLDCRGAHALRSQAAPSSASIPASGGGSAQAPGGGGSRSFESRERLRSRPPPAPSFVPVFSSMSSLDWRRPARSARFDGVLPAASLQSFFAPLATRKL